MLSSACLGNVYKGYNLPELDIVACIRKGLKPPFASTPAHWPLKALRWARFSCIRTMTSAGKNEVILDEGTVNRHMECPPKRPTGTYERRVAWQGVGVRAARPPHLASFSAARDATARSARAPADERRGTF